MKKKRILPVFIALALGVGALGLAACSDEGESEDKLTVTYYNEDVVLKTEKVERGGYAKDWEPSVSGYVFGGWYATPDYSFEFDFEEPVTNNTRVFGLFTEDTFEADTRDFYVMGTSNDPGSILYGANFEITDADAQKLDKTESETVNEYKITMDCYVGDKFQFAIDENVSNQRGFGYIDGETDDFEIVTTYLSDNPKKSDIRCTNAGNYTFTLTTHPWADWYDTDDEFYTEENKESFNYNYIDKISIVRNGDPTVAPDTSVLNLYVKGSYITGWGHDRTPEFTFSYDEEEDVYKLTHEFVAGDSFMFYNLLTPDAIEFGSVNLNADNIDRENSDVDALVLNPSSNIVSKYNGTYSFVYDRKTNKVVAKYSEEFTEGSYVPGDTWYISGSGITEPLKHTRFGFNLDEAAKLQKTGDLTYSITLDLVRGDLFQIVANTTYANAHNYTDLVEPERDGTTYFVQNGDNARVETSGNYTLTLILDERAPVYDRVEWVRNGDVIQDISTVWDVFLKSSGDDWAIHPEERVTAQDGSCELKATLNAGDSFCMIYYEPGTPDKEIGSYFNPGNLILYTAIGESGKFNKNIKVAEKDNNFECKVAGTYTIKVDFSSGKPVVDFVDYKLEKDFWIKIKGPAYNGTWDNSDPIYSESGKVTFDVKLTEGEGEKGNFGLAWYDEDTTVGYGNWIAYTRMGTTGDANDKITSPDDNNWHCSETGYYRIVVDFSSGKPVVDFFAIDPPETPEA